MRENGSSSKWDVEYISVSDAPEKSGVYVIYVFDHRNNPTRGKRLIYIGTTENLKKRLKNHEVLRILLAACEDWPMIKYKVVDSHSERMELERKLIKRLQPRANKQGRKRG